MYHLMATEYSEVASGLENSYPLLLIADRVTPCLSGYLPALTHCFRGLVATLDFWPWTLPRWFAYLDLWTPQCLSSGSG